MIAHRNDAFSCLSRRLRFAAAPVFAAMAVLSAMSGEGSIMCMPEAWSVNGMTTMYALMSVFHLAPWLNRVTAQASSESRQTCHSRAPPAHD